MTSRDSDRQTARFVAAMGHDLRTPLNAIIGFGEILARGMAPDPAKQAEFAAEIVGSARQLLQLINDVVDLARADAGALQLEPAPTDVHALVAEAVRSVAALAARHRVDIAVNLARSPARATLDAQRFSQAVRGMLTGAIGLAAAGGKVGLSAELIDGDRVRFAVTGLAIGADEHGELFRPAPGPRLGLALARAIIEAHGGEVGVSRALGGGGTLYAIMAGTAPLLDGARK
jgi:two-component system cell cycle sensor histidine kinase PleC